MVTSPVHLLRKGIRRYRRLCAQVADIWAIVPRIEQMLTIHLRESRLIYQAHSLPPEDQWLNLPANVAGSPGTRVFTTCAPCRQDSMDQPYFAYWTRQLHEPLRYHRKLWEFVFICQALYERGLFTEGRRGLGFGVGSEPLSAYFAAQGCKITATDMDLASAEAAGWTSTKQHALGKAALRKPHLCPDDRFEALVDFETCDMNHVPDHLRDYDFCWSACALEHLGSIEQGLAFIERSLDCLKPGGWAVHTTEFNIGSNEDTLDHGITVLFRGRDLAELSRRLALKGHVMAPLDLNPGQQPMDRYLDLPPYRDAPHITVALQGFAATSYGIIIQKAAG